MLIPNLVELILRCDRTDTAVMDRHLALHDARVASNVALGELSARTSLSPIIVRKIDEGRFAELPPGVYARSYVKAFAAEVGLDPAEALRKVEHLLPGAPDPLPVMRELKGPTLSDRLGTLMERVRTRRTAPAAGDDSVDDQKPDAVDDVEDAPVLRPQLTRLGAASIDVVVLITMNAALVTLVAVGTGLPMSALLRHGSLALAALCAVPTVLYFVLFAGIAGRTVGGRLCRLPVPPPHAPLTLDAIFRRSVTPGSRLDPRRQGLSRPALVGRGS